MKGTLTSIDVNDSSFSFNDLISEVKGIVNKKGLDIASCTNDNIQDASLVLRGTAPNNLSVTREVGKKASVYMLCEGM